MTRPELPEDTRPDYGQDTTEYRITLPGIASFFVESVEKAAEYRQAGAEVNARKGWE
jgi:hypothetical protein